MSVRATTAGAYLVSNGTNIRATTAGAYAVLGGSLVLRASTAGAYAVVNREIPCGTAPYVRVTSITATTATAYLDTGLDPDPTYQRVYFELHLDGALVDSYDYAGPYDTNPAFPFPRWDITGLTDGEEYDVHAYVLRECGESPKDTISFVAAAPTLDWDPGCPPPRKTYLINPDANPITPETRWGMGFFRPLPGEPLAGTTQVIFRWEGGPSTHTWDFEISEDLGETWATVASAVGADYDDEDGLTCYTFDLDTSGYTPGVGDYRLRATSLADGTVVTSLAFAIDTGNAFDGGFDSGFETGGSVKWWSHRGGLPLNDRFAPLWEDEIDRHVTGSIWRRAANDGSIVGLNGHNHSAFVDLEAGAMFGADVTVRAMAWSGEGGPIVQTGVWDLEALGFGIAFMARGETPETRQGLAMRIDNLTASSIGCCDGFLTNDLGATVELIGGYSPSSWSAGPVGSVENGSGVFEDGETGAVMADRSNKKFFGTATWNVPWMLYPRSRRLEFGYQAWRNGNDRGLQQTQRRSCGRRYEIYALRVKIELDQTRGDYRRFRIRTRLDGPGTEPPASGYWHSDRWVLFDEDMECGYVGFYDHQVDVLRRYSARLFYSMSIIPGETDCVPPPEPEPEEPEETVIPAIGPVPCPPEEITASHALWLGTAGNNDLLQYGASELDDETQVLAIIEPLPMAPEGFGSEFMVLNTYLAVEHIGDVYLKVTPIANGERLTDEAKEFSLIGPGDRLQPTRVEMPWTQPHPLSGSEKQRRGVRCQHFTVRIEVADICGSGMSIAGIEHEIEPVRERLGHSSEFTEWALDESPWVPGTRLMLGARSSRVIHAWTSASEDDSGTDFGWRVKPEWVAPAGIGGEAIFTNVYLVVSHLNEEARSITVTPHVDGEAQQPRVVTLPAATEFTTEVFEVAIQQPYPSVVSERQRYAPRGCWFTAEITGAREDQETIVLEGMEVEFETVRETQEPVDG